MNETDLVSKVIDRALAEMTIAHARRRVAEQSGASGGDVTRDDLAPQHFHYAYSAMVETLSKKLASITEPCASDDDLALRERVSALTDNPMSERPSEIFEELCKRIGEVYREEPTPAEILATPATVDLVRYMIGASRSYLDRRRTRTESEAKSLAHAMRAANPGGTPGKLHRLGPEMVAVASDARVGALKQRLGVDMADKAAIEAAYKVFRRENELKGEVPGDKECRTGKRTVAKFLTVRGCLTSRE